MNSPPIGIFDSGVGGLMVAQAVKNLLPQEVLVYFGDTAHLPYGDKSAAAIQARALKICDFLLNKHCKTILIACHSASATAYEVIRTRVSQHVEVLNVIDPVVAYLGQQFPCQSIGLIGTQQTVQSGVYAQKIQALGRAIQIQTLATPLLVPMIEASFPQGVIDQNIVRHYLQNPLLQSIKALVLGCTHYIFIKKQLEAFYQNKVAMVDASQLAAEALQKHLSRLQLLSKTRQGDDLFVGSDLTPTFEEAIRFLFCKPMLLEQPLI